MGEQIQLIGISAYGIHGVYPQEKLTPQEFIVDLHLTLDRKFNADQLDTTLDYAQLCDQVRDLISATNFELIETLANEIANLCLLAEIVVLVEVRVSKPTAAKNLNLESVAVLVTKSKS